MNCANIFEAEFTHLTPDELAMHRRAIARGANLQRAEIAALDSIIEIDACRLYLKLQLSSTFAYATRVMKLKEDVAVTLIRIARKGREVPALLDEVRRGAISISNARVVVPVLSPENATEWLAKARTLPKSKLEKAVVCEKPSEAVKTKIKPIAEAWYKLEIGLPEELWTDLQRAQDLCCQSEQRAVDLVEMLATVSKFFLKHKDPVEKAKRAKAIRPGADRSSARRKRSPIPAAARHVVFRRDRGRCQAQGPDGRPCHETRWTDLHHIHEVQHGGTNEPENLITLCAHHHRLHHRAREA